jgi:RimJ/RimL family protein N-acetyltransferase
MLMSKNPILLDIPDEFETERLLIRGPRPGDGAAMQAAIVESEPELIPWMPWAAPRQSVEEVEILARRMMARRILREEFMWLMFRKSDGLFAGSCGMHHIDWDVPRFEIGYWLRTSLTHHGYITEAVSGLVEFCCVELGAKRLEIRCDALNTRSAAVAQRVGFALEARLQGERRGTNTQLSDTLVFAKICNN